MDLSLNEIKTIGIPLIRRLLKRCEQQARIGNLQADEVLDDLYYISNALYSNEYNRQSVIKSAYRVWVFRSWMLESDKTEYLTWSHHLTFNTSIWDDREI